MTIRASRMSHGSSPLARGTRGGGDAEAEEGRFIPAGAGNTRVEGFAHHAQAVHPRWRGEHEMTTRPSATSGGSSPLARGTPTCWRWQSSPPRFIPAGAGNTHDVSALHGIRPVHPRWRGEHRPAVAIAGRTNGSSPLARGTLGKRLANQCLWRFIPAGAGNTQTDRGGPGGASVHPRWRGEHGARGIKRLKSGGSSPLARGTRVEWHCCPGA